MTYKIIATDLDGTLLDSNGNLSDENLLAIGRLAESGVNIVLSTGRTLCEIPDLLKSNPNVSYLIGSNGATVWDLKSGDRVIDLNCNKSQAQRVLNILKDYECNIVFRFNGQSYAYTPDWTEEKIKYYNICEPHRKALQGFGQFRNDFYDFAFSLESIETFAVFFHSEKEMHKAQIRLLKENDLHVVEAWDYNLEIFSLNSGKGNALAELAKSLGVKISEVIAVGDSGNDISMIKAAGLGLCVKNGVKQLKEIADEIICSNDEHIMQYILNFFIAEQ